MNESAKRLNFNDWDFIDTIIEQILPDSRPRPKFDTLSAGSFMKDDLGTDYFLLAHVDTERVQFNNPKEKHQGIDFINEIDAWKRMEFKFTRRRTKHTTDDTESLIYGFRDTFRP